MKKIFILLPVFLIAAIVSDFKNGNFKRICTYKNIQQYAKNEKILSLIGVSCVKSDNIYLLTLLFPKLRKTKEGRLNLIYFNTIYLQKRILYSFLFDGLKLEGFSFPMTDYVLSIVFDKLKKHQYTLKDGKYYIKEGGVTYILYKKGDKMILDSYKNGELIKRRGYK